MDIVKKIQLMSTVEKPGSTIRRDGSVISGRGVLAGGEKPFDAMNNIVANLLLNITRCCKSAGGETLRRFSSRSNPYRNSAVGRVYFGTRRCNERSEAL